jgi:peptide deformylase
VFFAVFAGFAVNPHASMIRPILKYGDTTLHEKARDVDVITPEIDRLVDDLVETMYAAPGVGLAAPQVGVPLRIFVVDISVGRDAGGLMVMINPEFVERDGMQLEEEGCLSVPGFNATVVRSSRRSIDRASPCSTRRRACSRARFSTRWITWTARCSSTVSAASSVI